MINADAVLQSSPESRLDPSQAMDTSPLSSGIQDDKGGGNATECAMDVDSVPAVDDTTNTGNRVVAVRTTCSSEGEEETSLHDNDDRTQKYEPRANDQHPAGEEKGKDKDDPADVDHEDASDDDIPFPPRAAPRRPGWGRHPDEDIFHTVPRSHGGPIKKRAVFRLWPRDPNGGVLMPKEEPRGTLSPDGYAWGETLYDLYSVNRCPDSAFCMMTTMTGSALLEVMKEMGELDVARPEIEWATSEGKPRDVGVADTAQLVESIERQSQLGSYHEFSMREDVRRKALAMNVAEEATSEPTEDNIRVKSKNVEGRDKDDDDDMVQDGGGQREEDEDQDDRDGDEEKDASKVENDDTKVDPTSVAHKLAAMPIKSSPFHPSHYPTPWPFIPFETPLSVLLQERLPLYLLPQKLYVHDPFNVLDARERLFNNKSWTSRPDIVRTYDLRLSEDMQTVVENNRREAEKLEEFKARTLIILRYQRTKEQVKNHEPVIEAPLPPYPRRLTNVEESHLYISPAAKIGDGNHSIVYKGEWELPRDLFVRPKLCRSCFEESVDREIQKLKDTGRWDKMLKAVGWGPTGYTECEPKQEELDEVNDPINLERDGEIIEREITCIVPPNASPMQIFQMVDESDIWKTLMKERSANGVLLDFTGIDDNEVESTKDASVAAVRLDPLVAYERQRTCNHGPRPFAAPHTTRFTVIAKLSFKNDTHLKWEADNYQVFPDHFFNHYNGYTIISQLHTIVPVGAVVPQFYGYYVPKKTEDNPREYLSPILLLEHCGSPIDPEGLSVEEQEECVSLLLRFQRAGWIHASIAPRNFLVQRGRPTEFPIEREHRPDPSFRLIDFGRSKEWKQACEKQQEEMWALRMFLKLTGSMNVTLVKG